MLMTGAFSELWILYDCINVQQLFHEHKDNTIVLRLYSGSSLQSCHCSIKNSNVVQFYMVENCNKDCAFDGYCDCWRYFYWELCRKANFDNVVDCFESAACEE